MDLLNLMVTNLLAMFKVTTMSPAKILDPLIFCTVSCKDENILLNPYPEPDLGFVDVILAWFYPFLYHRRIRCFEGKIVGVKFVVGFVVKGIGVIHHVHPENFPVDHENRPGVFIGKGIYEIPTPLVE